MFDVLVKLVFTLPFTALMKPAAYWIDQLKLTAHPEGGFYREMYRSEESIPQEGLPNRFSGARSFSTGIYFLLRSQDFSAFHRIHSDEMWHFYAGSSLTIYVLDGDSLGTHRLGLAIEEGERPQVVIPAGKWFAARVNHPDSYVLAGCTVAPGFDFKDFELADRASLLNEIPSQRAIIEQFTHA
jgi:uncharacterized protein